jgi:predicted Fe-Mo cluster-binding NifX family protein
VFDSSRVVVVVDIKDRIVSNKRYVHIQTHMPYQRAVELSELGIHVLICGAISKIHEDMIETQGIEVISFISGDIDQVIESYINDELDLIKFSMPGCCKRHRKRLRGKKLNK